jgi:hypothetical protein
VASLLALFPRTVEGKARPKNEGRCDPPRAATTGPLSGRCYSDQRCLAGLALGVTMSLKAQIDVKEHDQPSTGSFADLLPRLPPAPGVTPNLVAEVSGAYGRMGPGSPKGTAAIVGDL